MMCCYCDKREGKPFICQECYTYRTEAYRKANEKREGRE